jgi:hypothetical protein
MPTKKPLGRQNHKQVKKTSRRRAPWPSRSFGQVFPGVLEQLKRGHRMLTQRGFLIVADPLNDLGDGKTWVLECECTDKLAKDADPVDLARQCLESDDMATDGVSLKGRTLYVALSPPAQRTPHVGVQPAPASPESDRERLRVERLRKTCGVNLAGPPLPSYGAIITKYEEAHNGERPSLEDVMGEAMKSVRQSLGLIQPGKAEHGPGESDAIEKGQPRMPDSSTLRADEVRRVCEELAVIRPRMTPRTPYNAIKTQFPGSVVFSVCETHKELKLKLENIQEHQQFVRFAIEIVAAKYGRKFNTVEKDWKKHKPRKKQL